MSNAPLDLKLSATPFPHVKESHFKYYYIGLSLSVWLYLIYKAVVSPLVMDEATTFIDFAHTWDILPGQGKWVANNHYLNTFLVALSTQVFGIKEWVIRLPNVLSFLLFARYIFLWGTEIKDTLARTLFPIAMYAALFYIDFFALARGYGMSMAFLLAGAYHQAKSLNKSNGQHQKLSFLFMTLAILANFNLQFIYLIWWALEFWNKRKSILILRNILFLALRLLPIALTIVVSIILKSKGSLYLGHENGLSATFKSISLLISNTFHYSWWILLVLLTLIAFTGWVYSKNLRTKDWQPIDVLLIYLFGNIFMVWFIHVAIGVLYPVNRASMHWLFLWLPALFVSLGYLPKPLKIIGVVASFFLVGFQFNYLINNFSWNRNMANYWRMEQIDSSLPDAINSMSDPEITIGGSFFHFRQWAFQELKLNPSFPSQLQMSVADDTLADYLLSATADTAIHSKYKVFKTRNRLSLLKRKKSAEKIVFARLELDDFKSQTANSPIFTEFGIPCMGKQMGMRLEFDMDAEVEVLKSAILVHLFNNNNYKVWEEIRLDYLYNDINTKRIVVNFLIPSQTEQEIMANVSFLNFDKKKYEMSNVTCYFYNIE